MTLAKTLKRLGNLPEKERARDSSLDIFCMNVSMNEFVERYLRPKIRDTFACMRVERYETRSRTAYRARNLCHRKPRIRIPTEEETLTMRNYNSMSNMEEFVNKLSSNKWSFISWSERCHIESREKDVDVLQKQEEAKFQSSSTS